MPEEDPKVKLVDSMKGTRYNPGIKDVVSILKKPVGETVPSLVRDENEPFWEFVERILYMVMDDEFISKRLGILKYPAKWALGLVIEKIREIASE